MGSHDVFFAAVTTLDKLKAIPPAFWGKVGLGIAAVIIVFIVVQKVLNVNKFVLGGVTFIAVGLIFFNWIYHRTEPKFLTPIVNRIAPFFPAAGSYDTTQSKTPDETKK
jgi:predicted small secreted protein